MYDFIFKIVPHNGKFKVNQESNGYWWYHDGEHETREAAEAWARARAGKDARSITFAAPRLPAALYALK